MMAAGNRQSHRIETLHYHFLLRTEDKYVEVLQMKYRLIYKSTISRQDLQLLNRFQSIFTSHGPKRHPTCWKFRQSLHSTGPAYLPPRSIGQMSEIRTVVFRIELVHRVGIRLEQTGADHVRLVLRAGGDCRLQGRLGRHGRSFRFP